MYNFCFKSCLATLAIATALGVAAIWVPDAWHEVGAKLLWTDVVLFVGSVVGAGLCHIGIVGDRPPTSEEVTREVNATLRKELRKSPVQLYQDTE